jgi:hypothetical protein
MGVLEDAIREHLDLKRRHGASDEELNRQEAEALGPARREASEAQEEEADVAVAEAVEPPEAALRSAGPEAPPAPADEDTVIYAPGEAPVAPEEDEDPDFGAEPRERKPPGDLDFD